MIIRKDGYRIKIQPADLDGDGQTGGIEKIQDKYPTLIHNDDVLIPQKISESKEAMHELNEDIEGADSFSPIDFKTRLHGQMIPQMAALEGSHFMGFLPSKSRKVLRLVKRIMVSEGGLGRKEAIELNQTLKGQEENKKSVMDRVKNAFGFGE